MGPATVVMRIAGDEHKMAEKLKEIFGGKEVDWIEGIGIGEKDDTIIALTRRVLNGPVADFLDTKLLISKPIREVQDVYKRQVLWGQHHSQVQIRECIFLWMMPAFQDQSSWLKR